MLNLNQRETDTPAVALTVPPSEGGRTCHLLVATQALDEQGRLIEAVIRLAFDTLGARRLVLRVYQAEGGAGSSYEKGVLAHRAALHQGAHTATQAATEMQQAITDAQAHGAAAIIGLPYKNGKTVR